MGNDGDDVGLTCADGGVLDDYGGMSETEGTRGGACWGWWVLIAIASWPSGSTISRSLDSLQSFYPDISRRNRPKTLETSGSGLAPTPPSWGESLVGIQGRRDNRTYQQK